MEQIASAFERFLMIECNGTATTTPPARRCLLHAGTRALTLRPDDARADARRRGAGGREDARARGRLVANERGEDGRTRRRVGAGEGSGVVGLRVGRLVGILVGAGTGARVGLGVGAAVGTGVGVCTHCELTHASV